MKRATSEGALRDVYVISKTPENFQSEQWFDVMGRVRKLVDRRDKSYRFDYTKSGKPALVVTPMLRTHRTHYDDQGRIWIQESPSGNQSEVRYDAFDRPETVTYRTGGVTSSQVGFGYDDRNNVTSVTDAVGIIRRTYSAEDRVMSYTNTASQSLNFSYDGRGLLLSIRYPDGKTVRYTYDAAGRMLSVTDWRSRKTSILYDQAGRMAHITRPNGTVRKLVQDDAGQLVRVEERMPAKLGVLAFDKPIAVHAFRYTNRGTVDRRVRLPLTTEGVTVPSFDALFDDDNRMLSINGLRLGYDGINPSSSDGLMTRLPLPPDLLAGGGASGFPWGELEWDSRARLTSAKMPGDGGWAVDYVYDGEGHLIRRTRAGRDEERFVVNPHGSLSQVLMKTEGQITTYYVHGPGLLYEVEVQPGSSVETVRYYHYDHLGSTIALTGDRPSSTTAPVILGRREYSPYGMVTHREGTVNTPFQFLGALGALTDARTGLIYMRARWYNPLLCRFVSQDPIQFGGGMNWYAYADGDPLNLADPLGLGARSGGGYSSNAEINELISTIQGINQRAADSERWNAGVVAAAATDPMMQHWMRQELRRLDPPKPDPAVVAMDGILLAATFLSPLPGDEAAYISLRGGSRLLSRGAARGISKAPDFIVSPGGTVFVVPKGASGPFPVASGKGFQYTGGSGGSGLNPKAADLRIMDPVTSGKYQYPTGYGSYGNAANPSQTINPYTGKTIAPSDSWWHIRAE